MKFGPNKIVNAIFHRFYIRENTNNKEFLSMLKGHASEEIKKNYLHDAFKELRNAVNKTKQEEGKDRSLSDYEPLSNKAKKFWINFFHKNKSIKPFSKKNTTPLMRKLWTRFQSAEYNKEHPQEIHTQNNHSHIHNGKGGKYTSEGNHIVWDNHGKQHIYKSIHAYSHFSKELNKHDIPHKYWYKHLAPYAYNKKKTKLDNFSKNSETVFTSHGQSKQWFKHLSPVAYDKPLDDWKSNRSSNTGSDSGGSGNSVENLKANFKNDSYSPQFQPIADTVKENSKKK